MACKKTTVPFTGTPEQRDRLIAVMEELKDQPGSLLPVMQKAQEIYGYLPIEVQTMISDYMNIPIERVYGIATFYAQFALEPKGKYQVSVCLGTACYVKGGAKILETFEEELGIMAGQCTEDGLFSIDSCRCVGACGLAPVAMINDKVYGRLTPDEVRKIVDHYKKNLV